MYRRSERHHPQHLNGTIFREPIVCSKVPRLASMGQPVAWPARLGDQLQGQRDFSSPVQDGENSPTRAADGGR